MSTGLLRHGDRAAREVSARFGGYFANDAALTAMAAENRADGMVVMVGSKLRVFSATATAGGLAPDAGTGRWLETSAPTLQARLATATFLPNNTRTGNVLLADAVGALGNIDGVAAVVGNKILVKDEVAQANNGLYVVTSIGAAGAEWSMVRAPEMDTSDETKAGTLVVVAEGTANADATFVLTSNDPITLNTDNIVFGDFEPDGSVGRSDIAADAIDGTKIADDAVDSEHIANGAIDLAHMSVDSVDSDQYVDGSIDLIHMSANSVDSAQYVDGSIDPEHLAAETVAPIMVVRVATAAALPANTVTGAGLIMTADADGNINDTGVDGIVDLAVGEYLLIKNEVDTTKHGVWQVTQLGVAATSPFILTRVAPFAVDGAIKPSMLVGVSEGTANLNSLWKLDTNDPITIGASNLVFTPAIETASLADGSVTTAKLAAGAALANLADGSVTAAKLANGAGVAALLTAGLGNSINAAHDSADPTLLAADAVNDRACIVMAIVTEAFTTTAAMSVQSSAGAPVVLLDLAALTGTGTYFGAGVVPAHATESEIIVDCTDGATGEASITILAFPT